MFQVKLIESQSQWEKFLLTQPQQPFFQSWDWGEVQKNLGNPIFRYGIYNGTLLVGICLVVEIKAKRSHFLHLRHGPVLQNFEKQFDAFLFTLRTKAKELNVDFIRISPLLLEDSYDITFLRKRGFKNAPIHNMDAENTWVLDLDKSEEEILAGMRKTTRYLVRKAQTLPITITASTNKEDFDTFMELYEMTSARHGFIPHKGVEKEFEIFSKSNNAKLYLAHYEKKLLAGAIIIFYGDSAIYHHGASSNEHKEIPAAYLLQWEAIKEAKKMGKKIYNFWGVVPEYKTKHPWQGLSLFKMGFGGRRVNFIHAQDLSRSPMYWKSFLIETAWRIKRGY